MTDRLRVNLAEASPDLIKEVRATLTDTLQHLERAIGAATDADDMTAVRAIHAQIAEVRHALAQCRVALMCCQLERLFQEDSSDEVRLALHKMAGMEKITVE